MRYQTLAAAYVSVILALSPNLALACEAAHIGEPQIRVAALVILADRGEDQPMPLVDLVEAVKKRLVTCEDAREQQLIENRIRVMAYRSETTTGLKDRGQADYDPEANAWILTKKGAEEVAIWKRLLRVE